MLRKNRVIGGITYRMFKERNFVEIVFCTVSTDEQINVSIEWDIQFLGIRNKTDEPSQRLSKNARAVHAHIR